MLRTIIITFLSPFSFASWGGGFLVEDGMPHGLETASTVACFVCSVTPLAESWSQTSPAPSCGTANSSPSLGYEAVGGKVLIFIWS